MLPILDWVIDAMTDLQSIPPKSWRNLEHKIIFGFTQKFHGFQNSQKEFLYDIRNTIRN